MQKIAAYLGAHKQPIDIEENIGDIDELMALFPKGIDANNFGGNG